jgi:NAD(P)-dependent dehydrogenase (short-subunit alcohol dehydrogenase family)
MPRTVLVTEADSPLGAALARLLAGKGCSVVAAVQGAAAGSGNAPALPAGIVSVPWNRRSPVSSRNLLLTALNSFPSLDEALVLEPVCPVAGRLEDAESAAIEKAFDDARGPVFAAREILAHFRTSGAGVLALVSGGTATGPVEGGVRELFRGVASGLLAAAALSSAGVNGAVMVNGFQQGDSSVEEYAAFIDRTLDEKARKISGRWFTASSRGGIFSGSRPPRKG